MNRDTKDSIDCHQNNRCWCWHFFADSKNIWLDIALIRQHVPNLNSKERMEKEQISTPLPAIALNMPPIKPTKRSTKACHIPKFTIESKVFRLCSLENIFNESFASLFVCCIVYLFKRNKANAKLNQIQTNPSFFWGGVNISSTTSKPNREIWIWRYQRKYELT